MPSTAFAAAAPIAGPKSAAPARRQVRRRPARAVAPAALDPRPPPAARTSPRSAPAHIGHAPLSRGRPRSARIATAASQGMPAWSGAVGHNVPD